MEARHVRIVAPIFLPPCLPHLQPRHLLRHLQFNNKPSYQSNNSSNQLHRLFSNACLDLVVEQVHLILHHKLHATIINPEHIAEHLIGWKKK